MHIFFYDSCLIVLTLRTSLNHRETWGSHHRSRYTDTPTNLDFIELPLQSAGRKSTVWLFSDYTLCRLRYSHHVSDDECQILYFL